MPRTIVLSVQTAGSGSSIFEAITTAHGLRSFWTPDADADPHEGGALRFGFHEAPVDLEATVGSLKPGSSVTWTDVGPWPGWVGTEISWSIGDGEDHRVVTLVHDGWPDATPDADLGSVAMTWAQVLMALRDYVETGEANPALT